LVIYSYDPVLDADKKYVVKKPRAISKNFF